MELRHFAHKDLGRVELRANGGGGSVLSAYGVVWNRYSQNLGGFVEQIDPAALDRVLTPEHDTYALQNHDSNLVLGRTVAGTMRIGKDTTGARYEADMPDTQAARDLAVLVQRGDVTGSSFSFSTAMDGESWSLTPEGFPLRTITSISRLYDMGPVTYPAYLSTMDPGAAASMRSMALTSLGRQVDRNPDELAEAAAAGRLTEIVARHLNPGTQEKPAGPSEEAQRARIAEERKRLNRHRTRKATL